MSQPEPVFPLSPFAPVEAPRPARIAVLGTCHRCGQPMYRLDQPCPRVDGAVACNDPGLPDPALGPVIAKTAATVAEDKRAVARAKLLAIVVEHHSLATVAADSDAIRTAAGLFREEVETAAKAFVDAHAEVLAAAEELAAAQKLAPEGT